MPRTVDPVERRAHVAAAARVVIARDGLDATSVRRVAAEAGSSTTVVTHYFADKQDLYAEAMDVLYEGFHHRVAARAKGPGLAAYADAALALDGGSDVVAARAWVGLFAEALSSPVLFDKLRRLLAREVAFLQSHGGLAARDASAVLSFVVGALVFGSFAPRTTQGFAAPSLHRLLDALSASRSSKA